jgi:hypothetical protein
LIRALSIFAIGAGALVFFLAIRGRRDAAGYRSAAFYKA